MGTHDLETINGPFTYEALPPEDIVFAPLNQEKVMNGKELMEFYEVCGRVGSFTSRDQFAETVHTER